MKAEERLAEESVYPEELKKKWRRRKEREDLALQLFEQGKTYKEIGQQLPRFDGEGGTGVTGTIAMQIVWRRMHALMRDAPQRFFVHYADGSSTFIPEAERVFLYWWRKEVPYYQDAAKRAEVLFHKQSEQVRELERLLEGP